MKPDLSRFIIRVQGGKEYLTVAGRLHWLRSEHRIWGIVTEAQEINLQANPPYAIFRATITDAENKVIATATKREDARGFADFIEKAETGSVGRALAFCGYGSDYDPDLQEINPLSDSPVKSKSQPTSGKATDERVAARQQFIRFMHEFYEIDIKTKEMLVANVQAYLPIGEKIEGEPTLDQYRRALSEAKRLAETMKSGVAA
jgi:hypothetical protein